MSKKTPKKPHKPPVKKKVLKPLEEITLEAMAETIKSLSTKVEELEGRLSDTGDLNRKMHDWKKELTGKFQEYKGDIVKLLEKHNDARTDLDKRVEVSHDQIGDGVNTIHQGLIRLEHRANIIWNTFSGFLRFIEEVMKGKYPAPGDASWTRESFTKALLEEGAIVYKETMEHEKSEFARMKAEKAKHGKVVSPLSPKNLEPIDELFAASGNQVIKGLQENAPMLKELGQLRREGMANNPPPTIEVDLSTGKTVTDENGVTSTSVDADVITGNAPEANDNEPAAE